QGQWTAGVQVGGGWRRTVDGDKERVVERRRLPDVVRAAADVAGRKQPRAHLSLDRDVPHVDGRGRHVVAQAEERSVERKRRRLIERDREDVRLPARA